MRLLLLRTATLAALTLATPLPAQERPIEDLLRRAKGFLDNFRYREADSVATETRTTFRGGMTTSELLESLAISAAARYPQPGDSTPSLPDHAANALREMITLDMDASVPREYRWPGLDSILTAVRASTLSTKVATGTAATLALGDSAALYSMRSTRSAEWRWELVADGAPNVVLSGAAPRGRDARIHIPFGLTNGRPNLVAGRFIARITARDAETGQELVAERRLAASGPALELLPVPAELDASQLLPERVPPSRARGVVVALASAAVVVGGTIAMRSGTPLASAQPVSGRLYLAAGALVVGSVAGGLFDRGFPDTENIAENARRRQRNAEAIAAAQAENARRTAALRITLQPETQP